MCVIKHGFFYLRHAQTDAHKERRICGGDWNIPLNEEGVRQAREAAIMYRNQLSMIRQIVSSPLIRAEATARSFAETLGVPMAVENDFMEWRLGEWDRKPWVSVPDLFTRPDSPPGGETRTVFDQRIEAALNRVDLSQPTLVVAHGAVWFSILRALKIEAAPHIPSCAPFQFIRDSKGAFSVSQV